MSIKAEINRLSSAKAAIKASISGKGVTVPSAAKLDAYAALIDSIQTGGPPPVIQPLTVTENGTFTAPSGVDGYSPVEVKVPTGGGGASPFARMELKHWIPAQETAWYQVEDGNDLAFFVMWNKRGSVLRMLGGWVNDTYGVYLKQMGWIVGDTTSSFNGFGRKAGTGLYDSDSWQTGDVGTLQLKFEAGTDYVILLGYGPITE